MKKVFYILTAAFATLACAKEWPWADKTQPTIVKSEKDGCYELFISIDGLTDEAGKPAGESIETKAAINETDGTFTWTAGDEVDVITDEGGVKHIFKFSAESDGSLARFIYDGDDFVGTPVRVEYPSTSSLTPSGIPAAITGNTGALASANLRLTGDSFEGNTVTLHHNNALVRLEFHDVPTFANVLLFDGNKNDVTVTFTPLGSRGNLVAYVPVDPSTTSFTVYLKDNNNNVITSKATTTDKTFTAGALKVMASVAVSGWVFQANSASGINQLRFCKRYNDVTYDEEGSRYNATLNVLADGTTKWAILPSDAGSWVGNHYPVALKALNSGSEVSHTDCIYLSRDFVFDLSGNSLKTDYRVYPHGGSYSSPFARAYYDEPQAVSLIVDNNGLGFTPPYLHIGFGDDATTWSTKKSMVSEGGNLYSYTFPSSYFGTSGIIVVSDTQGDGKQWQSNDYTVDFTSKKSYTIRLGDGGYGNNATITQVSSTDFDHTEILGAAPGTAFTSPASITGASGTFLDFEISLYGKEIKVVFSDNGSNAKPIWTITINREYDYSL